MLLEKIREFDIPTVDVIRPFENALSLVEYTRNLEAAEGFVVAFGDGHRVKIKAEQYVRIHKTMERITFDRNIVDLIINEEVDDVIPMLPTAQVERIREIEKRFWKAFNATEYWLRCCYDDATLEFGTDRKRIALEFVPRLENKSSAQFIFRMLDGHGPRDLLLDHVRKSINTNTKWEQTATWLGM